MYPSPTAGVAAAYCSGARTPPRLRRGALIWRRDDDGAASDTAEVWRVTGPSLELELDSPLDPSGSSDERTRVTPRRVKALDAEEGPKVATGIALVASEPTLW